jgi:hypothetical protein
MSRVSELNEKWDEAKKADVENEAVIDRQREKIHALYEEARGDSVIIDAKKAKVVDRMKGDDVFVWIGYDAKRREYEISGSNYGHIYLSPDVFRVIAETVRGFEED